MKEIGKNIRDAMSKCLARTLQFKSEFFVFMQFMLGLELSTVSAMKEFCFKARLIPFLLGSIS